MSYFFSVHATVSVDLTDVPDLEADFNGWTFKPERATIKFNFDNGEIEQSSVRILGHRRLKSGRLGQQSCSADFGGWNHYEPPEWIAPYVESAKSTVLTAVGR